MEDAINIEADPASPEHEEGEDINYTRLDERAYELDEENDREVASRGGDANYTQNIEAGNESENVDDAEVRERELPIQDLDGS